MLFVATVPGEQRLQLAAPNSALEPGSHGMHSLAPWSVRKPGLHTVHAAEPSGLKPLSHAVHVSLAPRLNVLTEHGSVPVRSAFGLLPAVATEQYTADRADENSPGPSQGSQVAPSEEKKPGSH